MLDLEEGEYVTTIEVKHGRYVTRLSFTTNKGRTLGPCGGGGTLFLGGKGGEETTVHAPEGDMLVGIRGRSGKYLDAIGFHWAPVAACFPEGEDVELHPADLSSTPLFGGDGGGPFDHGHFTVVQ